MTKEEILEKVEWGAFPNKTATLKAMDEFAKQECKEKEQQIDEFIGIAERLYEVVGRDYMSLENAVVSRIRELIEIGLKFIPKEADKELKYFNYFLKNVEENEKMHKEQNPERSIATEAEKSDEAGNINT